MKVKAVLAGLLLMTSISVYSKDMSALYNGTSSALKNESSISKIFLNSKLASANFMSKLENLYFNSF